MKILKPFFLITDIGFITYWVITALHLIPPQYLYNDYTNPLLVAWNWSFLLLDLCVSASGLSSVYLYSRGSAHWRDLALISLVLTFCSGLQAISFFALHADFDPLWWLPNLYLLIYPIPFVVSLYWHASNQPITTRSNL